MTFVRKQRRYGALLTIAVSGVLAGIALRIGPAWGHGIVGDGDAWQNLWNIEHVRRWLLGSGELYATKMLWAPEGVGLGAHTLALSFSLPAALASFLVGSPLAHNLAVLASFVLCAWASYRLASTLGLGVAGAVIAALVITFSPPRFARSFGHLNLLGLGWVLIALEGMIASLKVSDRGQKWRSDARIAVGVCATVYTDYYLTILLGIGAVAILATSGWIAADNRGRRRARLVGVATFGFCFALPQLFATLRDTGRAAGGHDSKWCSCAVTSLVVPGRLQVVSALTQPLTERNHQNKAEGPAYLGISLLLCSVMQWRAVRGGILAVTIAGFAALILSLGPQLRVFDRLLEIPLPYAGLRMVAPILDKGGCVTRFVQLAYVPLGVLFGVWAEWAWRRSRLGAIAVCGIAFIEFLPLRPSVEGWQLQTDPALVQLAQLNDGLVADVEGGAWPLIRQLQHRHPIFTGYVSRLPEASLRSRQAEPAWAYLSGDGPVPLDPMRSARELADHWGVRWVIGSSRPGFSAKAAVLRLQELARSDRSVVYALPNDGGTQSGSLAAFDGLAPR